MVEIIALVFLCKMNGALAIQKGKKAGTWKMYTIFSWIVAEFIGLAIGLSMFGPKNIFGILGIGIFCAFGGYLIIRYILENKPDISEGNINRIGSDELAPPKK